VHVQPAFIEDPTWLDAFEHVLGLCAIKPRDTVCVLSETASRPVLVQLCLLAARRLGAEPFSIVIPSHSQNLALPIRSTGASVAIRGLQPVIQALSASTLVLDCTVEGLLHAVELPTLLKAGTRVLMVSNEHPEILQRLVPQLEDQAPVRDAMKRLRAAKQMHVGSTAGTDLLVQLQDGDEKSPIGGVWGWAEKPGQIAHWPGGLVLAFPRANSVNGTLVLDSGDINLTFKEYLRDPVHLQIRDDFIHLISGGFEAERLQKTWETWQNIEGQGFCRAVSHCGWGLNKRARWDALAYYNKTDINGTEQRAFAGNFLYSTGANETAQRHTLGHFDLPLRNCTVTLDGETVVNQGCLVE
jgi:2,5-dihydroxypyridine 5,6-dioxygenase